MYLTTRQIADVLHCGRVEAWREVRAWSRDGARVETAPAGPRGGRPSLTVHVADVALRAGLCVEDVLALAGVEGAA